MQVLRFHSSIAPPSAGELMTRIYSLMKEMTNSHGYVPEFTVKVTKMEHNLSSKKLKVSYLRTEMLSPNVSIYNLLSI